MANILNIDNTVMKCIQFEMLLYILVILIETVTMTRELVEKKIRCGVCTIMHN